MKEKSLSCMFSTDLFKLCSNVANCSSNCQLNQLPVTWKSFCLSQIRPLNCGKWVRETRDQRDTTWKMRRDGSRTSLPSPLCRCAHTQTHTHAQACACICIRLTFDWQALCPPFYAFTLTFIWSLTFMSSFWPLCVCCCLSIALSFLPSFFNLFYLCI